MSLFFFPLVCALFLSPDDFNNDNANVWSEFDRLGTDSVNDQRGARPVINVTTNNGFASGDGTAQNPYVVEVE